MTRQEIEFSLQEIYIGLLGRAADAAGLDYWADEVEDGVITLEQVRTNIVQSQPEYEEVFGGLSRAQTVNQLYNNLFSRDAEADGLTYWVSGGGSTVPIDLLVFALSNGALGDDRLILDNKVTVAQYFTQNASDSTNKANAALILEGVDKTSASVAAAKAIVDEDSYGANTFNITDAGDYQVGAEYTSIYVHDPDLTGDIVAKLTDADNVNSIEVFQTDGRDVANPVNIQFLDIQDINTDIKIVDTLAVDYLFTYDVDAYDGDNVVNLHLEEVGAGFSVAGQSPTIAFGTTAQGAGSSQIKTINITSDDRAATAKADQNYLQDLQVGAALTSVIISGDADFGVNDFLDANVSLVDAGADAGEGEEAREGAGNLTGALELKLHAQPSLTVYGALGNDDILIEGNGINNDVDLGDGADLLTINGAVSRGVVVAGAGDDTVNLNVGTVASVSGYDVALGDGNDEMTVTGVGSHYIHGGAGNDTVNLFGDNTRPWWDYDEEEEDEEEDGLVNGSTVNGGAGVDNVNGSEDNDSITAINVEHIFGDAGNDRIQIYRTNEDPTGNVSVDGGWGNDTLEIAQAIDGLVRTYHVESIIGSAGNDTVHATDVSRWDDNLVIDAGGGNDNITVGNGNAGTSSVWDATVDGGTGDDILTVTVQDDADVSGGNGNDTITVSAGDEAIVDGGAGNDVINVNVFNNAYSSIDGGLGNDTINLAVAVNGGEDTVVFGNVTYDALQARTDTNGYDIINGFNFQARGAGEEDVLNFDAFLVDHEKLGTIDALRYADWTNGKTTVDMDNQGADAVIAIVAAENGFVLNGSHITSAKSGTDRGIEIDDNGRAVVIIAKDTNSDFGFDQFDVYFVQDKDTDTGAAWAVDLVATINSATEIGAINSIGLDNLVW